jgi:hypothetical protein
MKLKVESETRRSQKRPGPKPGLSVFGKGHDTSRGTRYNGAAVRAFELSFSRSVGSLAMIVWLASYPRSGNSLFRSMLWHVWGIGSYSFYGDAGDIADLSIGRKIGHLSLGQPFMDAYEQIAESSQLYLVKTHEIPIDAAKAIYIVRDGRAASRSYCHYRRDFNGLTDQTANLRDVLLGFTSFGSWSNHLDAWNPLNRPNTLLLKYEQLLNDPASQIPRIADFIEIAPQRAWRNNFDEMARLEPRFFRAAAANDPQQALNPAEAQLFWSLHAPWMRRLGYVPADFKTNVPEASDAFRMALYQSVAEHMLRLNSAQARASHHHRSEPSEAFATPA